MARPAYVLPEAAVAGSDAVAFPGFPGTWIPGQPIAVDELIAHGGFADADALAEQISELGIPVEEAEVSGDDGAMPMPGNHLQNRAQAADEALEDARPRARSHKDLDKQAADLGVEFSKSGLTVAEKQAEIDAHIAADALVPEPPEQPGEDDE